MFMQEIIQDALDDLASTHSSITSKAQALASLERLLAEICVQSAENSTEDFKLFLALQDTFQCNVPSRILVWVSDTTSRVSTLMSKGSLDAERTAEVAALTAQLIQALSIIQGVSLNHSASKKFLGRRYALEILLDLLLTSRHVSSKPSTASHSTPVKLSASSSVNAGDSRNSKKGSSTATTSVPLTSVVLDTLLCILVDSSPALRVFENANGVQIVVRLLKRAGTPREVRMKCLEFLYFYLLDETATNGGSTTQSAPASPKMTPTVPNSPTESSGSFMPMSSRSADSSASSVLSSSTGSTSTSASYSTYATSFSSSSFDGVSTTKVPPSPPPSVATAVLKPSPRIITPPQPRSLLMLRKEVDFVPLSPKKAQISKLGVGAPRLSRLKQQDVFSSEETESDDSFAARAQELQTPRKGVQRSSAPCESSQSTPSVTRRGHRRAQSSVDVGIDIRPSTHSFPSLSPRRTGSRTMEEKKEILGSMLGNVDALVEGVRKAGIWGLG